jgi:ankyrin repeat protein
MLLKNRDVDNANRWVKCSNESCTTNDVLRNTPLIYAALTGQLSVVRVLMEGGANAESGNGNQQAAASCG